MMQLVEVNFALHDGTIELVLSEHQSLKSIILTDNSRVSQHTLLNTSQGICSNTNNTTDNVGSLLQTALVPHLIGTEVGVAASAVPVPGDGFGVEGHDHAKVLADAVQDEAGHPEVVAHVDALRRTHLELPLRRNHNDQWDSAKELQSHMSNILFTFCSFNLWSFCIPQLFQPQSGSQLGKQHFKSLMD